MYRCSVEPAILNTPESRGRMSPRRRLFTLLRGTRRWRREALGHLYLLVAQHLETSLAEAREQHERGLPAYVEKESRAFLKCEIHAFGFLRAFCKLCGQELLVALSCKRRGACPSCNARRMCGTAAHLVDLVLPEVPARQWVLSVPFELRLLLARNPRALSAVGRLFVERVLRWQRDSASSLGIRGSHGGAVSFPQRFGGSLNLNVHYHVAIPDGVFTFIEDDAPTTFHRLPALMAPKSIPRSGDRPGSHF